LHSPARLANFRHLRERSSLAQHSSSMKAAAPLFLLALALAACTPSASIVDIEEGKVLVSATGDEDALAAQEAQRGCGVYGRTAVPLSSWCVDAVCSRAHYLFACRR
jgi:hypothetical protein